MANQLKRFYLFNSDNTYNLEVVEKFLLDVEGKYGFEISVDRLSFGLQRMAEVCEWTLPQLVMDVAVFVFHANESRLSINEDNAGIGYATLYRALLQKTDDNVLIVIGGDEYYKDEDEEAWSFISRWARRKVASQFREEYLDGRQSFIFSWNEKHRPIHEEAMRHFLDPSKRGFKFEYTPPKPLPKPAAPAVPPHLPKPTPPADRRAANADSDLTRESSLITSDQETLIRDDEEDTGTRRRSFSDQDQSKSELRHDLERGTYGAVRSGETPALNQGDILLKAKVRFGRISYEDGDVLLREPRWRPTDKQESDVMKDLRSHPVRIVTFYRTGSGSVTYEYDKPRAPDSRCVSFFLVCCCGIWKCMVECFWWVVHCAGAFCRWCYGKLRGS